MVALAGGSERVIGQVTHTFSWLCAQTRKQVPEVLRHLDTGRENRYAHATSTDSMEREETPEEMLDHAFRKSGFNKKQLVRLSTDTGGRVCSWAHLL